MLEDFIDFLGSMYLQVVKVGYTAFVSWQTPSKNYRENFVRTNTATTTLQCPVLVLADHFPLRPPKTPPSHQMHHPVPKVTLAMKKPAPTADPTSSEPAAADSTISGPIAASADSK